MLINPLLAAAIIEFVVGGFIFIADDHVAIANRGAAVVDLGLVKTSSVKFSIFRPIEGRPLFSEPPGIQTARAPAI